MPPTTTIVSSRGRERHTHALAHDAQDARKRTLVSRQTSRADAVETASLAQ